jgi:hypothetical protein
MEHSDHWMGWKTVRFSNNEKTMEHSDHWIMTGWHGEQWDFQNNEKTMEHSSINLSMKLACERQFVVINNKIYFQV